MSKAKDKHAWVTRTDVSQWAMAYLERKCTRVPGLPPAKVLFEQLRIINTLKGCSNDNLKLLKGMQVAWRKKKSRDNQTGKKPHNILISEEAGRQLKRLSADYGETKNHALELIIADTLARENIYKAERKDEGVFKKREAIFERELSQAFDELHEYKLRLSVAGVDTNTRLDTKQQKMVKSLSRSRKKEVISQLPSLPVNTPKKTKKRTLTPNKADTTRSQLKPTPSTSNKATVTATHLGEQKHSTASEAQAMHQDAALVETGQAPENGMTEAPEGAASTQQGQHTPATDQPGTDTSLELIALQINLNEHCFVQVDNGDSPTATKHEEPATPQEHSGPSVTSGNSQHDGSFETSQELASTMTTTQDIASIAPALQEPVAAYQTDEDVITTNDTLAPPTTNELPDHRHLDEVETQHELTQEDMAELRRLLQDSASKL